MIDMQDWNEEIREAVDHYAAGPELLRRSLEGLNAEQLRTAAPPGLWSPLEVVCHIADFETIYANRIKRILAEKEPFLPSGDPDLFAASLSYLDRDLDEELSLIAAQRGQIVRILGKHSATDFERQGRHSVDGPVSILRLLKNAGSHIPHHVDFLQKKREALSGEA
jgi:hypothetical protein